MIKIPTTRLYYVLFLVYYLSFGKMFKNVALTIQYLIIIILSFFSGVLKVLFT